MNYDTMPLITIFTTVYNVEEYLPRFFGCMAAQTYSNYVLLIIDDGSEDNTLNVCRKNAEKDSRIQIVPCNHMGIAAARNLAISLIETPLAASADGDDVYEPDYLKHLLDAQIKYDADLVISRVVYRNEAYARVGGFPRRGEEVIEKDKLLAALPSLLDERRLNYLYAKLYRTVYLKQCIVESDVEQGSDTMINCQYVTLVNRIVLIDDEDTNYIRYSSRAVTSYRGIKIFKRLIRIGQVLADTLGNAGFINDEMQYVLDKRIFDIVNWSLNVLSQLDLTGDEIIDVVSQITGNHLYQDAYERKNKNHTEFSVHVIPPDKVMVEYLNKNRDFIKKKEKHAREEIKRTKNQLKDAQDAIWALEHSVSFRIGRVLTFPGRKFRDVIKKLQQ